MRGSGSPTSGRGILRRRGIRLVVVALLAAAALSVRPSPAAPEGLVEVGRFDPAGPGNKVGQYGSRLYVDYPNRRLLSLIHGNVQGKRAGYAVQAFDADSLTAKGPAVVVPEGEPQFANLDAAAIDMRRRRLFLAVDVPVPDTANQVWRYRIAAIDYAGPRPRLLANYDLTADLGPRVRAFGVSYFEPEDRLYVLSAVPSGQPGFDVPQTVAVSEFNAGRLARGEPALVWTMRFPLCSDVIAWNQAPEFGRSLTQDAIFFGCRQAGVIFPLGPGQPGIVRLDLAPGATAADTSNFRATLYPLSGDHIQSDQWFDPGSDRIIVGGQSNTSNIGTLWVFDGRINRWTGSIGVGISFPGGAIDPTTGRLYVQPLDAPLPPFTGFTLAEVRPTPVRQGVSFPRYRLTTGLSRVAVDPGTRRVFLERPLSQEKDSYLILRDQVPIFRPATPAKPDSLTIDRPEEPLVAGATFSGGGSGYAVRSLSVRGLHGPLGNVLGGFTGLLNAIPDFPSRGTRDVYLAQVHGAAINTSEAAAEAIAADRDPLNTGGDTAFAPETIKAQTGVQPPQDLYWPFPLAQCHGADAKGAEEPGARVSCDFARGTASALAEVGALELGALSITSARTEVTVRRDPKLGVVTTSFSKAEGILVGGELDIGTVETVAETRAHGRRGTAGSTITRRVADVRLGGRVLCEGVCADLEPVFRTIFEQSNGRIDISIPEPDPRLRGTPGGAEALVHRDFALLVEDAQINESPENRVEVPGLMVTVLNDGVHRSRQRFELAAVSAESHYFIFLLAQPGGAPSLPALPPLPPVPSQPVAVEGTQFVSAPAFSGVANTPAAPLVYIVRATGWTLALNTPSAGAMAGALFALLAIPVFLAARRRLLVETLTTRRRGIEA